MHLALGITAKRDQMSLYVCSWKRVIHSLVITKVLKCRFCREDLRFSRNFPALKLTQFVKCFCVLLLISSSVFPSLSRPLLTPQFVNEISKFPHFLLSFRCLDFRNVNCLKRVFSFCPEIKCLKPVSQLTIVDNSFCCFFVLPFFAHLCLFWSNFEADTARKK